MSEKLISNYIKLHSLNDSLLSIAQNPSATMHDDSWKNYNLILDELSQITGDNYYKELSVHPKRRGSFQILLASDYSIKVYQTTSYLYNTKSEQLSTQPPPQKPLVKRGSDQNITQTSVLSQDQQNEQKQHVEVNVEFNQTITYITEALVEAKSKFPEGSKERNFIDKLKESISTAKTTADLIKMVAAAAAQFGISAQTLSQIFH